MKSSSCVASLFRLLAACGSSSGGTAPRASATGPNVGGTWKIVTLGR